VNEYGPAVAKLKSVVAKSICCVVVSGFVTDKTIGKT
jgi:hypothetical protein